MTPDTNIFVTGIPGFGMSGSPAKKLKIAPMTDKHKIPRYLVLDLFEKGTRGRAARAAARTYANVLNREGFDNQTAEKTLDIIDKVDKDLSSKPDSKIKVDFDHLYPFSV
jgi:hypothetical protein